MAPTYLKTTHTHTPIVRLIDTFYGAGVWTILCPEKQCKQRLS